MTYSIEIELDVTGQQAIELLHYLGRILDSYGYGKCSNVKLFKKEVVK